MKNNLTDRLLVERFKKLAGLNKSLLNEYNPTKRDLDSFYFFAQELVELAQQAMYDAGGEGATIGTTNAEQRTYEPRSSDSTDYDYQKYLGYVVPIQLEVLGEVWNPDDPETQRRIKVASLHVYFDLNDNINNVYIYYHIDELREYIIGQRAAQMTNFITDEEAREQFIKIGDYFGKRYVEKSGQDPEVVPTPEPEPDPSGFCKRTLDEENWYDNNIVTGKSYLRNGDCGFAVETAQMILNAVLPKLKSKKLVDVSDLTVDGKYGNDTIGLVKKIQDILDLKADGYYGKDTHNAIDALFKAEMQIDKLPVKDVDQLSTGTVKLGDLVPIDITPAAEPSGKFKTILNNIRSTVNAKRQDRLQKKQDKVQAKSAKFSRPKQY